MAQADKTLIRGAAYAILTATAAFASLKVFFHSMTALVPANVVGLSFLRWHLPVL